MAGRPGMYKDPTTYELTPRQLEILQLSANGLNYPEIASELGISRSTIKNIMTSTYTPVPNAFERLGVGGITHAVAEAIRRGLIE